MLAIILVVVASTLAVAVMVLIVVRSVYYDDNAWLRDYPQKAPLRRQQ